MITLCIRYRIDPNKHRDFEAYARSLPEPIRRCGGELIGYFLPTRFAGRTDEALGLISFPDLATYERYRADLARDPAAAESLALVERTGCILAEDRGFLQPLP